GLDGQPEAPAAPSPTAALGHVEDEVAHRPPAGPAAHPHPVAVALGPERDLRGGEPVLAPDLQHGAGRQVADRLVRPDQPDSARGAPVVQQHPLAGHGAGLSGWSRSSTLQTPCTGEQCRNSGQVMNTTTRATIASTLSGISRPGKLVHHSRPSERNAPAITSPVTMIVGSANRTTQRNLSSCLAPASTAGTFACCRPAGIATAMFHSAPPSHSVNADRCSTRSSRGQPVPASVIAQPRSSSATTAAAAVATARRRTPKASSAASAIDPATSRPRCSGAPSR